MLRCELDGAFVCAVCGDDLRFECEGAVVVEYNGDSEGGEDEGDHEPSVLLQRRLPEALCALIMVPEATL